MIRHLEYCISICQLFVFVNSGPMIGQNVFPANSLEFPFIASLGIYNLVERMHGCTGSLITQRHVLTVAHCFNDQMVNQIDVIVGDINLRISNSTRYGVELWVTFNDWAEAHGKRVDFPENDIAIVKLASPVNRQGIVPVTLTPLNNDQLLYNTHAVVAGWGFTNENTLSNVLLKGKVTILKPHECLRRIKLIVGKNYPYQKNSFCASADPYLITTCGDSGAPLLDKDNSLLGVIKSTCPHTQWGNFSEEFLDQYRVNLATSVNRYREFIESVTNT